MTVVTAAGGYLLAGGSLFDLKTFIGMIIGTSLCASSAAMKNQIYEVKFDALMKRTKNRPLPRGKISIKKARKFGTLASLAGVGTLLATTNIYTAALGYCTILGYVHFYTPLKRITPLNTEFGAFIGSMPPLMG